MRTGEAAFACVIVAIASSLACTRKNPEYCDETSQCTDGRVCDLATHTCTVMPDGNPSCSSNDQCQDPMSPICTDGACVPCKLDDECPSRVCRSDGACESPENVLHVAPDGIAAGECTPEAPCDLFYARSLVTAERNALRVEPGTYVLPSELAVNAPGMSISIVGGRSAVFERNTPGHSFSVSNGATLSLRGITLRRGLVCNTGTVEIARVGFSSPGSEARPWVSVMACTTTIADTEMTGALDDAVTAVGGELTITGSQVSGGASGGVRMMNGQLTILQSSIFQNAGIGVLATVQQLVIRRSSFFSNRLGGISSTGGVFDITNNFIYRNGNAGNATFGGLHLDTYLAGNRVEHNTVVRNDMDYAATPIYAGGVFCKGDGTSANNLIANNFRGNEFDTYAQTGGTCTFTGSLVLASDDVVNFVRPIAEPFDYHLASPQSAAVNAGTVGLDPITVDVDGEPRNDGFPDVGADELPP